ncbi:hypothetical protein GCM10009646_74050 [Streptomyces aureus]
MHGGALRRADDFTSVTGETAWTRAVLTSRAALAETPQILPGFKFGPQRGLGDWVQRGVRARDCTIVRGWFAPRDSVVADDLGTFMRKLPRYSPASTVGHL